MREKGGVGVGEEFNDGIALGGVASVVYKLKVRGCIQVVCDLAEAFIVFDRAVGGACGEAVDCIGDVRPRTENEDEHTE